MCGRTSLSKLHSRMNMVLCLLCQKRGEQLNVWEDRLCQNPLNHQFMSLRQRAAPNLKVSMHMWMKSTKDRHIKVSRSCLRLLLFFSTPESFILLLFYQKRNLPLWWSVSESTPKRRQVKTMSGGRPLSLLLTKAPGACRCYSRWWWSCWWWWSSSLPLSSILRWSLL